MVFRCRFRLDAKLCQRLAQRQNAVFFRSRRHDQPTRLDARERFSDAVFVFAAMFAAKQQRRIVVLAGNIRRDLCVLRLKSPVKRSKILNRDDVSVKTV
ncbi:hypothetical protein D3C87_1779830 [compost metagenome]